MPLAQQRLSASRATVYSASAVSSADALAARRISVGINPNPDRDGGAGGPLQALPVSPYQVIAADVHGDGLVKSSRALASLRMAVKPAITPAQQWLFEEETRDFWDEVNGRFTLSRTWRWCSGCLWGSG